MLSRRRRRLFVFVLFVLVVACGKEPTPNAPSRRVRRVPAAPPSRPRCPDKPNVLIISIDTLRFDATSLDPTAQRRTAFLSQLRQRGINFTRCYSTHDSTPASHFSMLTGFINGLRSDIDVPEVSIVHQLAKHGYRTFGVSANGNLSASLMRSFSEFREFVNLYETWQKLRPQRKERAVKPAEDRLRAYGFETADQNVANRFATFDLVVQYAKPWLSGSQPFFGFLNFLEMHDPYVPDPSVYDRAKEERGARVSDLRFRMLPPWLADPSTIADAAKKKLVTDTIRIADGRAWSTTFDLSSRAIAIYKQRYYANALTLDNDLRALFDLLQNDGLLDSTIIVITSDHGEAFGEKHLITHSFGDLGNMQVTHAVPLLILFPPCYGYAAKDVAAPCTIADIPPTVYDILGIDPQPIWSKSLPGNFGRSLLPLVTSAGNLQVQADTRGTTVSAAQRKAQDDEALKRFRALGYVH